FVVGSQVGAGAGPAVGNQVALADRHLQLELEIGEGRLPELEELPVPLDAGLLALVGAVVDDGGGDDLIDGVEVALLEDVAVALDDRPVIGCGHDGLLSICAAESSTDGGAAPATMTVRRWLARREG